MKVLLIEPTYEKLVIDTTSIPLGIASLATHLALNKIDVSCIDESMEELPHVSQLSLYDIIGIQLHSYESLEHCIKLINNLKKSTSAKIVVGGVVATFYYKHLMLLPSIDYIVLHEGEHTFLKLVQCLESRISLKSIKGLIINGQEKDINLDIQLEQDLDSFPIPDRGLFKWDRYKQWSIVTSRGCPYKCRFCTTPNFWKGSFRQRSPQNIIKEIIYLIDKYKVDKILIPDDTFTVNKKHTLKLLSLIEENGLNFEWACLTRADLLDDELLELMKKTGCKTISIGVESANQDTLEYLRKDIKLETISRAISLVKKHGISIRTSFIFGFPNEEEIHLQNNIDFLKINQPNEIQIYPLFPYFGTELNRKLNINIDAKIYSRGKDALNPIYEPEKLPIETIKTYVIKCVTELQKIGYTWMSSHSTLPSKYGFKKVVMTEFAPIQNLKNNQL